MRWQGGRQSGNIEDRRGTSPRMSPQMAGMGGGGAALLILMLLCCGLDPLGFVGPDVPMEPGTQRPYPNPMEPAAPRGQVQPNVMPGQVPSGQVASPDASTGPYTGTAEFVAVVLAQTEDTWGAIFQQAGSTYPQPKLVLYTDAVQSACGFSTAATGPFYCPLDQKVYLDLSFLDELRRLGAPGEFAFAYVIAHEIGHHVQRVIGVEPTVRAMQQRASPQDRNALSVLMELQADCLAGVWAHHTDAQQQILEPGDIESGLRAAAAVGDDRLQRMAGQRVQPEAFTHGTSEQRMAWFEAGLESGSIEACDTFTPGGVPLPR